MLYINDFFLGIITKNLKTLVLENVIIFLNIENMRYFFFKFKYFEKLKFFFYQTFVSSKLNKEILISQKINYLKINTIKILITFLN